MIVCKCPFCDVRIISFSRSQVTHKCTYTKRFHLVTRAGVDTYGKTKADLPLLSQDGGDS